MASIEQQLSNTSKGRMDAKIIDIVKVLKAHGIRMPFFPKHVRTTKQKVGYYGLLIAMAKKHDLQQRHFWYLKRKEPFFKGHGKGSWKVEVSAEEMMGIGLGAGLCGRCAKALR